MNLINGCCSYEDIPTNLLIKELVFNYLGNLDIDSYLTNTIIRAAQEATNRANAAVDTSLTEVNSALEDVNEATENLDQQLIDVADRATQSVENAIKGVAVDANLVTDALTTVVPITNSENARTQLEKNRESVSLFDFFTKAELALYKTEKNNFDVTRPLQEFFDYIAANDAGIAYCSGDFKVSSPIVFGGQSGVKTKHVVGRMYLRAKVAMNTILKMQLGLLFKWTGVLAVQGIGGNAWDSNKCNIGVHIGGQYATARCHFDMIRADNCRHIGIFVDDNTTLNNFGILKANTCGSGRNGNLELTDYSTYSNVQFTGNNASAGQRSTFTVAKLPETMSVSALPTFAIIDGEYYFVHNINTSTKELTVFPWLKSTDKGGDVRYAYGGGVLVRGSDASINSIGSVDSAHCGIAYHDMALYACLVDRLAAQVCGVGLARGNNPTAVNMGGEIGGFYTEGNGVDILKVTETRMGVNIKSRYEINYSKIRYTSSPRRNDKPTGNLEGFVINNEGNLNSFENSEMYGAGSFAPLKLHDFMRAPKLFSSNGTELRIQGMDVNRIDNLGIRTKQAIVVGTGSNRAPTGTITITAPTGFTLNETTSVSYSGFAGPAKFDFITDVLNLNIICTCANLLPVAAATNKTTHAYASKVVPANTSVSTTVTVPNAKLGDIVRVSLDKSLQGTQMNAEAEAGVVIVNHYNPTAASVTLAAGTLTVKID